MGKGGYNGGSTIIRPGSGWLTDHNVRGKPKITLNSHRYAHLSEAEIEQRIERAAERLAKTKSEFDAGLLKPDPPKSDRAKIGKKRRKKLKLAAKRAKRRAAKK